MDTPKKPFLIFENPCSGTQWVAILAFFLITCLVTIVPLYILAGDEESVSPGAEVSITRAGGAANLAEVTWFRPKDGSHTVAVNPRHSIPDGAYIEFTNLNVTPAPVVIVRKQGHMAKHAEADFDLCPEAFARLAPLSHGRLYNIEWRIVRQ